MSCNNCTYKGKGTASQFFIEEAIKTNFSVSQEPNVNPNQQTPNHKNLAAGNNLGILVYNLCKYIKFGIWNIFCEHLQSNQ